MKTVGRALGLALVALLAAGPVRAEVSRVSVAADGTEADGVTDEVAVSADGHVVAFTSSATTLVAGCGGAFRLDLFVKDRAAGSLGCVRTSGGDPASPALSADGRFVAFRDGVGGGATAPQVQTFVHDRLTGVTEMASVASDGTPANPASASRNTSTSPAISADGRYVAFGSNATNLAPGVFGLQIYVRDRVAGQTSWVSRTTDGHPIGAWAYAGHPALSADGRFVAWASGPPGQIYVHDRQSGVTEMASVADDGTPARVGANMFPTLSADGRYVAFVSDAPNLVPGDTNGLIDVFVRDRVAGTTRRASVGSDGTQGDRESCAAMARPCLVALSADGRYVAFVSQATALVTGDDNGAADVFVHDRTTGQTIRASVGGSGQQAAGESWSPGLAADGAALVFVSAAANLVVGDTNGVADAFFVAAAPPAPPAPPGSPGPPAPAAQAGFLVTVPGPGGGPDVRIFGRQGLSASAMAYAAGFTGGLFVAAGRLGDAGELAVVTGADAGGGPHVRVLGPAGAPDGAGAGFFAYDPGFRGGVRVASCDVDGDGRDEVVTAPGPGSGPHVRVWQPRGGAATELAGFFAYAPGFAAGLFVACGDLDGRGRASIVTGADAGGGPHVRIWDVVAGVAVERAGFFAYEPGFTGGVRVAVGDLDGDGRAEVVTGPGSGGGPHVRVFRAGPGGVTAHGGAFAFAPTFTGGVYLAAGDLDGDGRAEIVVAAGPGGGPHVRVLSPALVEVASFFAYDSGFTGGVRVAVGGATRR